MSENRPSRRDIVARRFKPLLARLPARDVVEGVQPLNPGYFTMERIRTEARPKTAAEQRVRMVAR